MYCRSALRSSWKILRYCCKKKSALILAKLLSEACRVRRLLIANETGPSISVTALLSLSRYMCLVHPCPHAKRRDFVQEKARAV